MDYEQIVYAFEIHFFMRLRTKYLETAFWKSEPNIYDIQFIMAAVCPWRACS